MTDPRREVLVAGDDEEAGTRAAYTRVLEAALTIVQDLASHRHDTAPRPNVPPVGAWVDPTRRPPTTSVAEALSRGWLVTPGSAGSGGSGALAGLTVALKDNIDVAGFPTRNGTPSGGWRTPTRSAPAWQRLAEEGATCVGKAAMHEMAWGVTTPMISNPLDEDCYCGGSSGGSAAAVASGVCTGALGTDTGGSIRIPAALCGVVGLRPTHGLLPVAGVTPLAPNQDVVGPIATDVVTCTALMERLLGHPLTPAHEPNRAWRVGIHPDPGPMDEAVAEAYRSTLEKLSQAGVHLVECPDAPVREASALSVVTMLVESAGLHAEAVRSSPYEYGGEARALLTLAADLVSPRTTALLERSRSVLHSETTSFYSEWRLDAFLTPTTPCVAPRRDHATVSLSGREIPVSAALSRHTAWAAAIGWPAISTPAPTPGPLPAGMQLMTPPHRDDVCLSLASLV